MNKKEAYRLFKETYPPETFVSKATGRIDKPMRDQAWNDFTDALCKDGQITQRQYSTWTHPYNRCK